MSFEARLMNRSGTPFRSNIMEVLVRCVTEVLLGESDADPEKMLRVAQRVGNKAEEEETAIQDLYGYTKRSLYRQVRSDRQAERELMSQLVLKDTQEIEALKAYRPSFELNLLVESCLAQLNPIDRKVLLLYRYKGLDHAAIAKRLNITVASCWFRLSRANAKLKKLLALAS